MKAVDYLKNNPKTFAVTFAQIESGGNRVGKNKIYWQDGFFHHEHEVSDMAGITAWAEGGSCMVNKELFRKLRGFDPLYSPFYWEDIDLSYRAYKAGYEVYFDPGILVHHAHESTIGKYYKKKNIKRIALRHQLIFIWKNITDPRLRRSHASALVRLLISSFIRGKFETHRAWLGAIIRYPGIVRARRREKKLHKIADTQILDLFKK